MLIRRDIAYAPRARALGHELARLEGDCVGCKNCTGICTALLEALTLPDFVLKEREA